MAGGAAEAAGGGGVGPSGGRGGAAGPAGPAGAAGPAGPRWAPGRGGRDRPGRGGAGPGAGAEAGSGTGFPGAGAAGGRGDDPLAALQAFMARGAAKGAARVRERGTAFTGTRWEEVLPVREDRRPTRVAGPEGGGGAGPSGVGRGPSIWAPGGTLGGSEDDDDVVFLGERGAAGVVDDDCRVLPEGPAPLRASEGAQQERRKRGAGEAPRPLFCVECGSGPFKDAARLRVHCVSRCKKRTRPPSRARAPSEQKSSYGAPNTRKASPPPPRVWATVADMWRSKARAQAPVGGAEAAAAAEQASSQPQTKPRAWWTGPDASAQPAPHPAAYPAGWFGGGGQPAATLAPGPGGAFPSPMDTWSESGGRDGAAAPGAAEGAADLGGGEAGVPEGESEQDARKRRRVEEYRRKGERERAEERDAMDLRPRAEQHVRRALGKAVSLPGVLRRLGVPVPGGHTPSRRQVTAAYRKALLQYHPDRVSGKPLGLRLVAEEAFKAIKVAHARFEGNG